MRAICKPPTLVFNLNQSAVDDVLLAFQRFQTIRHGLDVPLSRPEHGYLLAYLEGQQILHGHGYGEHGG